MHLRIKGVVPVSPQISGPTLPKGFGVTPSYNGFDGIDGNLGASTLVLFGCVIVKESFCLMAVDFSDTAPE